MPRRRVFTDAQITALFALPTAEADLIRHYTLGPDDLAVIARRRRPHNRLGFALQLCALRFPGRLIRPGELIPLMIVTFVAEQLDIDPGALADYATRAPTRYDQLDALRDAFGFRTFTQPDHRELSTWLVPIALATVSAIHVAEALMAELRRHRIAAPGPTTVERMVATALLQAERHAAAKLSGTLSPEKRTALDALLDNHPGTAVSSLAWARQSPGAPGHRSMTRLIDQLRHLRQVGITPTATDGIHADRVRQLAREGSRLTAQHLRALGPLRRHAVLIVTVLDTITRLTDEAIGLFDRLIGRMFRRAERRASANLQTNARSLNDKVRLLTKLGDALFEARETGADAFAAVDKVIPWDRFAEVVAEAKGLIKDDGLDYLALAEANHALLRRVGPLFLDAFEFQGIAAVTGLLRAVATLRTFYAGTRRTLPKDLPTGFIRRSWRPAVFRDGTIDGQAYELCLFAELRDRLRAGDVWVVGSRQYRAVEDQLISKPLFAEMKAAGPLPVGVPSNAALYLQDRKDLLDARLRAVCEKAAQDQLVDVRLSGDTLKISPLQAATPEEAERLADRVYARMPRVRITDLLDEVAEWTGIADCFTHLRTGLPAEDRRVVLTAVLADATNLGLTRMAEACSVASYKQLAWTAGWHVSEDAYGRALVRIVAAQQAQPLAARFGSGTASSSDGQHFPLGGRGEVTGAVNPHKGTGPAISFYTHISDRYAPYHTKAISVAESEAAHVIDGLLYHGTDAGIAVHHVDGGGVSDHVFALCHLLGFRFAPRIPNLHDRRLYTFGPAAAWPRLEPFIAGRIDEALIQAHWDDVLRLATSIRTGAVPASLMLKRLGSYPRQNGLALALREVGRIERTAFTLEWLQNPALRRQATAVLNKGESRNGLARAVCFHRLGRIPDRTPENQQHRAGGLNLVVAAIILWNTVYMERAINALRAGGEHIPDGLLSHLAPLGWQHINLTGDYLWSANRVPSTVGYRPLRAPTELLAA
ncbi:Tn3 family transposase [Roseomonas genomospecies 6]|uniref:Tn3 family transposase n=1 Tax=Roseomonas genomospecies 6 TaxID=214106 RepID=A0A9W7KMT4_9PROT|nr:Tn3 family transposase [Roseomonas genomospecies 6]KAA0675758.1 Tn3 family transposase [Roseomonas genomospecies 6]